MAKIVENKKGFKVIEVSMTECTIWGGYGICDICNKAIGERGYYFAVLNWVMCEKCYNEWLERAENYPEDRQIEDANFRVYKSILGL